MLKLNINRHEVIELHTANGTVKFFVKKDIAGGQLICFIDAPKEIQIKRSPIEMDIKFKGIK